MNIRSVPMSATSKKQRGEKFKEFHKANPHIFKLLVKYAREIKEAGVKKIGISLLIERVRWHGHVKSKSKDGYKISNNHRAFYSRKLMRKYPEFEGLFTTKSMRPDKGKIP